MVAAWSRADRRLARAADARVFHLHHLTPIHEAAAAVMPDVPIVTHLHGTELKMLDAIARGERASARARTRAGGPSAWARRRAARTRRS